MDQGLSSGLRLSSEALLVFEHLLQDKGLQQRGLAHLMFLTFESFELYTRLTTLGDMACLYSVVRNLSELISYFAYFRDWSEGKTLVWSVTSATTASS